MPDQSIPPVFSADSIVETVREPLLVLSADLRVRKANRSFFRTFKVSPEETTGQLIYDLGNHQWDIPLLRKLLEEVLPENAAFDDFEVDHVFPAIGRKCMLLNARRISRADNTSESILLAIEDITARREAEEARADVESRYTSLVRNIRDHSIFMMDIDGHITTWNVEAERIIGYHESEILGRHFSVIFTPEDLQAGLPQNELQRARNVGRAEDERWHLRKDGSRFWALGIVTPMHDSKGSLTGFSKILRDMTDRKQAQAALQASEVRYRRLFQTAKDGILILDAETGKILDANPFMTAFLGYSHGDFSGKELWEIGLYQDINENQSAFRELQENGYLRYDNLPLESFHGRHVEVEVIANVHKEDQQSVIQCNIRDITERKLAEAQLKNANANLKQKNREMEEFAHTVSHDLKSPLVTIGGLLGLLKEELQEQRLVAAGELIATAEETVAEMRDMIGDLLTLSQIGNAAIDLQPVGLRQVAEELVRKHAPQLDAKHTAVSLELNEDRVTVLADRNRLVQILDNLLVNALKYACDGPEPRITIGSEKVGREVRLFVKDNGPGIAAEHHDKIFGLFQRLDESKEGTGVGLSIVKRIMEVYGGRVWVESAIGEGATFWLAFPAAASEAAMSLSAQGSRERE